MDAARNNKQTERNMANYNNARSKFDPSLDIKEIAKRLRRDIKAMQKMGLFAEMKVSVRIERFSMGQAMNVTITKWDGQLHNPEWLETKNSRDFDQYAPRVRKALEVLERLAGQWNYDNSDSMVDYFDVNYYTRVSVGWELAEAVQVVEEAKLAAVA